MTVTLIEKFPTIDYVLVKRESDFQPYIACWHFDEEDSTWGQGHYFETEKEARNYIKGLY